jgi:hypothetical protein
MPLHMGFPKLPLKIISFKAVTERLQRSKDNVTEVSVRAGMISSLLSVWMMNMSSPLGSTGAAKTDSDNDIFLMACHCLSKPDIGDSIYEVCTYMM